MPSALLCENTMKCRRFGFLHEAKASQKAEKTAAKPLNECGCVLTLPSLFHSTLSGLIILPLEDGEYRTNEGKSIRFDKELGLMIEEGVS